MPPPFQRTFEELVLNLIDHAVDSVTDRIDLGIDLQPVRVVLVLEDDGAPFDPRSAPAFDKTKPLVEREPRGMGIHLVRSMTESIAYERVGKRNRLQVVIRS
jgi:serine/threonine-protein kinase RsbW